MSYQAHIRKTWDEAILFSVLLELTHRCNLDCFICYNDRDQAGSLLSVDAYRRLLDDLAEMQVLHLILSGGEPLAHPDVWAIGGHARRRGFVMRIKSNGHLLTPETARRVQAEIDPFVIDISLHGATATTHERQTRIPGSFARLLANLRAMRAIGLRLKLNSPVTRWNEHELADMFALAESLDVPLALSTRLTPRDDGDLAPLGIAPTREGIQSAARLQREAAARDPRARSAPDPGLEAESERHCGAGASTLAIDPYGDVYPCVQWRRSAGTLHRQSIQAIWRDSPVLHEIRDLTREIRRRLADETPQGGFCPALAEQQSGSVFGVEPEMRLRMEAQWTGEILTAPDEGSEKMS